MNQWLKRLRFDPTAPLLSSGNEAIRYFCRRNLLDQDAGPIENLWHLPEAEKLLGKQLSDGSWAYPGGGKPHLRSQEDYSQLETFRMVGELVEKYGLDRRHSGIKRAADYLFSKQTEEGDFRGIYGHQYSPNYSAAIMELLIKAGYDDDPHIDRGFQWLVSMRQDDGGWAVPLRTAGVKLDAITAEKTITPDRSKPSSHWATGVVLRAFAAHEKQRKKDIARSAGQLLASRFFKKDTYPDRQAVDFWTRFSYPFWFTDLLSSLDSLSLIGFSSDDPHVSKGIEWLVDKQHSDGTWRLKLLKTKDKHLSHWIALTICRVLKRFYD